MRTIRTLALATVSLLGLSSAVLAADLIVSVEEPSAAPSAASVYLGLIGGYGTATGDLTDISAVPVGSPTEMSLEGYLLGVQAGIDLPMSDSVVLGLVGDVSWANIAGDSCVEQTDVTCSDVDQTGHSRLEANIDWLATLRARLGVDVGGVLLYGTAGVAMADVSATVTNYDGTNDADGSASHYGYAVGVGADFDVADNLTVGVEYLYVDLGAADYSFDAPVGDVGSASLTSNILRASVKMHF